MTRFTYSYPLILPDGGLRTVVVDYEYQAAGDWFTVQFSGELLRAPELNREVLGAALQQMALQHARTPS